MTMFHPTERLIFPTLFVLISFATTVAEESSDDVANQEIFFESKVRPLLVQHCQECHGKKKQQGELRLDRKASAFAEHGSGPILSPGKPEESRLIEVLKWDENDIQMPPKGKLSPAEIAVLTQWVKSGAYWPDDADPENDDHGSSPLVRHEDGSLNYAAIANEHWSYRPVQRPTTPEGNASSNTNEIDAFILRDLKANELDLSPQASKETIIRRLAFDLTGLPPTMEEVQSFVADENPKAIELLINKYLNSPLHGQRWGRYWLDIARYADTKGYVFTENRFYPYSYTYRDYVIDAFNNDKPYDEFVKEQLAADLMGFPENDSRLAALGFITIGPRFLNRQPDIIDDRIDVVSRGLLGMTVACARCHDHKFDPIPTADYYSLYGVFQSSIEPDVPPLVGKIDESDAGYQAFKAELDRREMVRDTYANQSHEELSNQIRQHAVDYMIAIGQAKGKVPKDAQFPHGKVREKLKAHWIRFAAGQLQKEQPYFVLLNGLLDTPADQLAARIEKAPVTPQTEYVLSLLNESPPKSHLEVVTTFGEALAFTFKTWNQFEGIKDRDQKMDEKKLGPLVPFIIGTGSLVDVPGGTGSPFFERDHRDQLRKLEKKVSEWHTNSPNAPARAMVLNDRPNPIEPVIFVRGNVGRRGDKVPRRIPHILDPREESKFQNGSGRLEFANAIASKDNPLTARVIVNRVWAAHFGTPLVATTSDFGIRGEKPSHPELLDYLAWSLMHKHNWSIKGLHREILLSRTWLQSSSDRAMAREIDPENRLYWKQNRRRRDFESMRDSMLFVSGRLDTTVGGKPVNIETEPFSNRRSIYALIDRNNFSGLLRTFDFPSPDASSPGRPETMVPQQALFAMNAPFAQQIAASLAERISQQHATAKEQVTGLFETVYTRPPTSIETEQLTEFLKSHSLEELCQGVLMTNEFLFVD